MKFKLRVFDSRASVFTPKQLDYLQYYGAQVVPSYVGYYHILMDVVDCTEAVVTLPTLAAFYTFLQVWNRIEIKGEYLTVE